MYLSLGTSFSLFYDALLRNAEEEYTKMIYCRELAGWEKNQSLSNDCYNKSELFRGVLNSIFSQEIPPVPTNQYDLFYGLSKFDNPYVTQGVADHYQSNRLMSTDIGTGGKSLSVYAMDCNLEMCEWDVSTEMNEGKGNIVILTNSHKNMMFRYGHTLLTTDKKKVHTGEKIGRILCPNEEGAGVSTGCHLDFSFWVQTNGNWTQAEYKDNLSVSIEDIIDTKLKATSKNKEGLAYFTTYNGECNQTKGGVIGKDGNCYGTKTAPCAVGKNAGNTSGLCGSPVSTVTGANLKELYEKGENPIALTRDLIEGDPSTGYCSKDCPFKFWDRVLVSPVDNWQQPYTAILVDAKAKRFKNGGDQFHLDRKNNNSYMATIKKL